MRTLFSILLVAALSGCAIFTSPKEQPVLDDYVHDWIRIEKIGVLSTTAERREVIFKMPDNKFCAEPPPDVAEALASSLTLLAEGSAKDKTSGDVKARLEVAKTLATSIRTLFRRSQGAQFFRDGLFNLCQAYLNGVIIESQYIDLYKELVEKARVLVLVELPLMQATKDEVAADDAVSAAAAAKEAVLKAVTAETAAQQAAKDAAAAAEEAKQSADAAAAAAAQQAKESADRAEAAVPTD